MERPVIRTVKEEEGSTGKWGKQSEGVGAGWCRSYKTSGFRWLY